MEFKISTPQFKRVNGVVVKEAPKTVEQFKNLELMPHDVLKELGLQLWDEKSNIWLYPCEWYDSIPDGYPIVDLNGITEEFKKGETDNDIRFGALAYGLKSKIKG